MTGGEPSMANQSSIERPPAPISGWPLPIALRLDQARPGYLAYLCRGSVLKRQANFMAMSLMQDGAESVAASFVKSGLVDCDKSPDILSQVAQALVSLRATDICRALAGDRLSIRLLQRIGDQPLARSAYSGLITLFTHPDNEKRADLLRRDCSISGASIQAALHLPEPLIRPQILSKLFTPESVEQLAATMDLILALVPRHLHAEIWQSVDHLGPRTRLSEWLCRLLDKATSLPISRALKDDDDIRLLNSPKALRECGQRFGNCLGTKVAEVALQRTVFYIWRDEAIVELQALSQGQFLLKGIFGRNNGSVAKGVMRSIRLKFEAGGVLLPRDAGRA
jgi:hypothetical protein